MKKKLLLILLVLSMCLSQGAMIAQAEPESSTESGMVVTQSGNASSDTTLSSLKIAQAALQPEFDPQQLTYTATVPYEVERVALNAQTNCVDARKVIRGTSDLEVGENTITVTVTAQNGSTREYRITLIRQEKVETTDPSEEESQEVTSGSDETQETTPESSQEETSEEETSQEETTPVETTPEETTPVETIIIPTEEETTQGMQVEVPTDQTEDSQTIFSNQTLWILVLVAVSLVSLFAIIALLIIRKEADDDDDPDDEEELVKELRAEQEQSIPMVAPPAYEPMEEEDRAYLFSTGELAPEQEEEFYEYGDGLLQEEIQRVRQEVYLEEEILEELSTEAQRLEDAGVLDQLEDTDDLDDDFEMLLEDDDDFDFLEF